MPSENIRRKDPRGLDVIEALVPQHSRIAFETGYDYFSIMNACKVSWWPAIWSIPGNPRKNCELVGLEKLWRPDAI